MSDVAIRCEGLSKQYRIGQHERYKALRDVVTEVASAPFRRLSAAFRNGNNDVLFEVRQGEAAGVKWDAIRSGR